MTMNGEIISSVTNLGQTRFESFSSIVKKSIGLEKSIASFQKDKKVSKLCLLFVVSVNWCNHSRGEPSLDPMTAIRFSNLKPAISHAESTY